MIEEAQQKPDEQVAESEEAIAGEVAVEEEAYLTRRPDEPVTSEEIKEAANDLKAHAMNVWVQPVRKEIRSWLRAGKGFLDGLGADDDKKAD